jgi:hypothetical protein
MADTKDTNPKDVAATTRIPLFLCSAIASAKWALAQFAGMIKYGAWNWRRAGVRSSVYLSAARRHIDAYTSGEEVDPVDGTDHRANVMACMAILMDAEACGKLIDDRPPSVSVRPTYAEGEALMAKLLKQYADKSPRHFTIADTEKPDARPPFKGAPFAWLPAIGDRVRIVDHTLGRFGQIGSIVEDDAYAPFPYKVRFDTENVGFTRCFRREEFELVSGAT